MLRTIIKHSLRSFNRQKVYFLINLLGLSVGIASSILIATYINHEAGYDDFNVKKDQIYRLILNGKLGEQEVMGAFTAAVIGPSMQRDFPEIEEFCRLNGFGTTNFRYDNKNFEERDVLEADSSFFRFFSIPLVHGNINTVLNEPYKAVVSKSFAARVFGNESPIDKAIQVGDNENYYTISGVMEDFPEQSHFKADVILSYMTNPRSQNPVWLNNNLSTYFILNKNSSPETIVEKIPQMVVDNVGPEIEQFFNSTIEEFLNSGNRYSYDLQPLSKVHLEPEIQQLFKAAADPKYLLIFGIVALLIIVIASINFMNLSTAQSAKRAREVGLKKVAGSTKGMLVSQFLSESLILTFMSLLIAVVLVKLALPWFNNLLNADFGLELLGTWYTIPLLIVLALIVGLLSGSYPAFLISSFSPLEAFQSQKKNTGTNGRFRSALVVIQFAASIILIVGTAIMFRQIDFMLNKYPGYDKEQLLVISRAGSLDSRVEAFKDRVKEIPGVLKVSASTAVPNRNNNNNGYALEGKLDESLLLTTCWADYDFIDTYQMEIVTGRFFDRDYPADIQGCIVNETMLKEYSLEDPLSQVILAPQGDGEFTRIPVIGVVKDFYHSSLDQRITPYIIRFRTDDFQFGYVTAKLAGGDQSAAVSKIEEIWKEFTNTESMTSFFMEDEFDNIYRQEKQSSTLTVIFALFAIMVASLGLYGLTSFLLLQRTKEIGVRKAMGSSVRGIFILVMKDILILVTLAAAIGSPIIYYFGSKWLENYYYRINIGASEFIFGFLVAVIIALTTISLRTLKAARANPANSLRYE